MSGKDNEENIMEEEEENIEEEEEIVDPMTLIELGNFNDLRECHMNMF